MQLSKIVELVQEIPVIDGKDHPAEAGLLERIQADSTAGSTYVRDWLYSFNSYGPASEFASLLKLLGRIDPQQYCEWGLDLFQEALMNKDAEVREAAVDILGEIGTEEALALLRRHRDSARFMAQYIDKLLGEKESQ